MIRTVRSVVFPVLLLGLGASVAQGQRPVLTVRGFVRDTAGVPVPLAEVLVEGTAVLTRSGTDGAYVLTGVPAGPTRLIARRLGYHPVRRDIEGVPGGSLNIHWILRQASGVLAPIAVTGRREVSDSRLAGFRARAEAKAGGHFITRERIEQSGNRNTLDAIRGLPGVRVTTIGRSSQKTVRLRGARCPPLVFLDGFPASATEFDLESIDLNMTEGIEVYSSSSSVPPEFLGPRNLEQCGVVAIWSRPAQARVARARPPRRGDSAAVAAIRASALEATQVDQVARIIGSMPTIEYPESLYKARVAGDATIEFVVGADGIVDWRTTRVVSATHQLFVDAIRQAMLPMRWRAAVRGGQPVAQLVVLPAEFSPASPPPEASAARP